jgi:CspA family cold shock protein
MVRGTVAFFHDQKGYGFIEPEDADEDADEDVFFHMEDVEGPDLEEDTEVEFDVEESEEGPRATTVRRV